jgi:hypothetical protein
MGECRQAVYTQKGHHLAERRAGCSIWFELALVELVDGRRGRDGLQAVFVIAAIHHPDQLDQEGIKLELIVAAIGAD